MSRSKRGSASGGIGLHQLPITGSTKSLSCNQSITRFKLSTYRAIWRSGMPVHRHTMHHTEVNKSHKFPPTGHCHESSMNMIQQN